MVREILGRMTPAGRRMMSISIAAFSIYALSSVAMAFVILASIHSILAGPVDLAPESLADTGLVGARGALEMVFRLEGEIGFRPVETEDGIGITVDPKVEGSQKLSQALRAWARMRGRLEAGEVSEEEYEAWKASFRG